MREGRSTSFFWEIDVFLNNVVFSRKLEPLFLLSKFIIFIFNAVLFHLKFSKFLVKCKLKQNMNGPKHVMQMKLPFVKMYFSFNFRISNETDIDFSNPSRSQDANARDTKFFLIRLLLYNGLIIDRHSNFWRSKVVKEGNLLHLLPKGFVIF